MTKPAFDHPWVDEKRDPIYLAKFPDPLPLNQYEKFIHRLDEWTTKTTEPYAWIIYPDLKTSTERTLMIESQARRAQYEKVYCSCYGFVVVNPLVRGVIKAVFWLNSPAVITKVFDTEAAALVWVSEKHRDFLRTRFRAS